MNPWSRGDKIALIGVVVAVVAVVATLVIPELRLFIGLDHNDGNSQAAINSTQKSSSPNPSPSVDSSYSPVPPALEPDPKVAGVVFVPSQYVRADFRTFGSEFSSNGQSYKSPESTWTIQLQDIALYQSGRAYLKISLCNGSYDLAALENLRSWYTSADKSASVNWIFDTSVTDSAGRKFVVSLKPSECQMLGAWSDAETSESLFSRGLGTFYVLATTGSPDARINLASAGTAEAARFMKFRN